MPLGLLIAGLLSTVAAPLAAQEQQDPFQAIQELFARYQIPGPEENAFPVYQEAFSLMVEDDAIDSYNRNARMGAEPPTAALAANEAALAKLDEALAMKGCLGPKTATWDAQLPWYASARQAARLLCCDGLVAEARGDYGKAFSRYCDAVEVGQDVTRGGPIIGKLVEVATTTIGLRQVRAACLTGQAPEEALAGVADRLARLEDSRLPISSAFAYEMMWSAEATLDMIRRPTAEMPEEFRGLAALGAGLNLDAFLVELLDYYSRCIQLSESSYRDTVGLEPTADEYKHPFTGIILPVVAKVRTKVLSETAAVRGTRILAGLARYRLANGGYPKELASLVPGYLPELPLDPYSGESFIYTPEPSLESFTLYSVGENLVDDLGTTADVLIVPMQ